MCMRTVGWQARRDANECTPPPAACPALPTCQTFPVPTPVLPRPRCLPAGGMEPPQRDHPCLLRRGPAAHGVGPLPHRGGAGGRAGGHTRQAPRGGGGAGGAGAGARLPSCRALLLPTLLPRPRFSTGLLWEAPDDVAPTCLSCPSHPPPLPHPPPPHPPTPEQTPEDAEDGPPELLFIHGGHTGAPPPPPPPPVTSHRIVLPCRGTRRAAMHATHRVARAQGFTSLTKQSKPDTLCSQDFRLCLERRRRVGGGQRGGGQHPAGGWGVGGLLFGWVGYVGGWCGVGGRIAARQRADGWVRGACVAGDTQQYVVTPWARQERWRGRRGQQRWRSRARPRPRLDLRSNDRNGGGWQPGWRCCE